MDMILFEVFLKSIALIPQQQINYYNGTIYIIDNVNVLSDHVESSGYILQKHFKRDHVHVCASGRGFTVFNFE